MTHTVRETGQWQHTLTIEVPADEVEDRLLAVSRRFQQHVSLPGFRKGKVPLERVRQDYAAEIERELESRPAPEELPAPATSAPFVRPCDRRTGSNRRKDWRAGLAGR